MDGLKPKAVTVTLPGDGWSNNQQTVTVQGVTASNAVLVTPTPGSWQFAGECGAYCSAQGTNSLTFTAVNAPTEPGDLMNYNVLIWEVQ